MVEGRQRLNIDRGQQTDTPYTPCVERLAGGLGQYILIFADDDDRLLWVWQLPYSSIEFHTCVIGGARPRATDEQLVGVGQRVCGLPSRKEDMHMMRGEVWPGMA